MKPLRLDLDSLRVESFGANPVTTESAVPETQDRSCILSCPLSCH